MRNGEAATEALVVAAQAGDRSAVAELVTAHLPLVYNVIGRALNGHADVDDVVQECMLRVVRGLPDLRDPDRFRPWVVSIAYRQVQEYWRGRRGVELPLQDSADDVPDPAGDFVDRTVSELVLGGQRRQLAEATRWLDAEDRHLLALWWQEATGELSRGEVVTALGLTERHAAVRLHRMKAQLAAVRTVVAALRHRPRCPELDALARSWDDSLSPLWRKRFVRHVRDCQLCAGIGGGLVPPEQLLYGLAPLPLSVAAAAAVRAAVEAHLATPVALASGTGGGSGVQAALSKKVVVGAGAVVALAVGAIMFAVHVSPTGPGDDVVGAAPGGPGPVVAAPAPTPTPGSAGPSAGATPATPGPGGVVTGVTSADIYVAPDGSDGGDGSLERPFATLNRAVEVVRPGQTIAMRGGTYRLTRPVEIRTSGAAARRIVLSAYRDERPILDATGVPADKWAVTQQTGFWTVQDLEVHGSRSHAWVCSACSHTTFQRLSMHDNARSGLLLRDPGTVGNQVLDSDFFRNHEPGGTGSVGIGLGVKFGAGEGNVLRGNRAFHNADDGFDFGAFDSPLTVERNWSYGNGQNRWGVSGWRSNGYGFSLGGGELTSSSGHRVHGNAAWGNRGHGFGVEANRGNLSLIGNTAFDNDGTGFDLTDATGTARRNLAVDNERAVRVGSGVTPDGNSWDGGQWTRSEFRSTDASAAEGARPPDGKLPPTSYLSSRSGIGADMSAS
ncbi:sigma-70 family RNA polymerase sigma factor [Polymorphospora lycopeni]|uniref:Sigma-70 family RNA polymerase sigma factor n=1 Tax=Polymorphospora lycopeni TaxID=3140240 RepID=A0ABV5CV88_9ACTN